MGVIPVVRLHAGHVVLLLPVTGWYQTVLYYAMHQSVMRLLPTLSSRSR